MTAGQSGTIGDRGGGAFPDLPVPLDEAVARAQLAEEVWPVGGPDAHAVDVHIHELRPRLQELGLVIHTLHGRGLLLETSGGDHAARRS